MSNTNELHDKESIKKLSTTFLTVSIVRATMMLRTFKNNKVQYKLFVLIHILNIEL